MPKPKQAKTKKKITASDDEDDDDFNPDDEVDAGDADVSDAAPSSDESDAPFSEGEYSPAEDAPPSKKGGKVAAPPQFSKGPKKKISYKCEPAPCGIKIESRSEDVDGGLAPISDLTTIFNDIISRVIPSIKKLMGANKHRKLRIATMCSGTESPLLALGMFSKAIKGRGLGHLEIEHVFSCEIEPYKQAYIERNFKPPILFRDIKELGGDEA